MLFGLDLTTLAIFIVIFLVGLWWTTGYKNLPPGPGPRLPFIGSLLAIASKRDTGELYKVVDDLGKEFGKIYMIQLGNIPVVVINDIELIKEAYLKRSDVFSNRPNWLFILRFFTKGKGLVMQNGPDWKELRRFAVVTLRDMGVGKKSLEERIQDEARYVVQHFSAQDGQSFVAYPTIQNAVSNIICGICFGNRFEYEDENFKKILSFLRFNVGNLSLAMPHNFIRILEYLPFPEKLKIIMQNFKLMDGFVEEQIQEHRKSFDADNIRDLCDLYLEKEAQGHTDASAYSKLNMHRVVGDLFIAGSETTSTTINYAILFMLLNPDMQTKCQEVIDQEIGRSRAPCLADKPNVPYVEAVLMETQRMASVVPLGVPHSPAEDTTLGGFTLPKDCVILTNQFGIHHDPKYWPDPYKFNPDRWLDDKGNVIKKDGFLPFSLGGRVCLGEILAKMELFLYFCTFLQQFRFEKETPETELTSEGIMGITLAPKPYKLRAILR